MTFTRNQQKQFADFWYYFHNCSHYRLATIILQQNLVRRRRHRVVNKHALLVVVLQKQYGVYQITANVHFLYLGLNARNLSSSVLRTTNKGADQPAHRRSLIAVFIIRLLGSIISKFATSEITILKLVSVAEETYLSLAASETAKTGQSYPS